MKLSSPKVIIFVFLSLCVVGIFIFYATKTGNRKKESGRSVTTTNNEQARNSDGESKITERDEPKNNRVENPNQNLPGYGRYLKDHKAAETSKRKILGAEESMRQRLVKELREVSMEGPEKDRVREWIRVAWGETESLSPAFRIDDVQVSLGDDSVGKSPSIIEGVVDSFESRGESGSRLLDLVYSRGLLLAVLSDVDRPAFDEKLQATIQNRGVDENISLLGVLFDPRLGPDVEKIEFRVMESLSASEHELPQIISLGLIELYLQLGVRNSEERERKLKILLKILGGNNWVKDAAMEETRQSLLEEVQRQVLHGI